MRLHHLEVTAFGPFSGTESVDFDALTDAGLFLLCGPTGAGKTSVLDAVCFGLYGEVPGDRNSAKRLRSDHAAGGVAPSVTLEVTISGRRFRIRRSPAWQRPKRRGTGTTTEHAKVNLEELVDGAWVHHSNRLDEAGQMMGELLGMSVTQFTQVAMLPQGRFQSFLRAKSDERHKVLQRLFRTARFEDIEKWLVNHRQSLRSVNRRHQDAVASVVSRISEAAACAFPAEWELPELAVPAQSGEVVSWSGSLLSRAEDERRLAEAGAAAVGEQVRGHRAVLAAAHATADLRRRHAAATALAEELRAGEQEASAARGRLDLARRAQAVAPLLKVARDATAAAERAQRDLGEVLADAAGLLGLDADTVTTGDLASAERAAHEAASVARALLPRERELQRARAAADSASARLKQVGEEAAALDARCAAIPAHLTQLRDSAAAAAAAAATTDSLLSAETALRDRLRSAQQATKLGTDVEVARELLRASIDDAQALRERMHQIREARINGMAAELALALGSGACCPVCGSSEHPAIAEPVHGAPTQADEDRARATYEDADFVRQNHAESVAGLERSLALAIQAAGGKTEEQLACEIADVEARRAAAAKAAAEHQRLQSAITALESDLQLAQQRSRDAHAELAALVEQREQALKLVESATAELSALFEDDEIADSVERLIEARSAAGEAFGRAREALTAREAAAARAREAQCLAHDCAVEHGFDSDESAAAALLPESELGELTQLLGDREERLAHVRAVLGDPAVRAAAAADPPDIDALTRAATAAEDEHTAAAAACRTATARKSRLAELHDELVRELEAWAPTRAAYAVARAVSTFAEGKSADNSLQMRLSAYVLAARLRQVVAAANERLGRMSDGRYALEHSASRGAGEQRGGLSLLVRDEWTGDSRDPATLSGGETFIASLALALGLADVVTHEAGGSEIDTLFIDEGFGTLDPETLDDVMNTLDGLRDGGRVVGIVSHVPEMRTRITAQLQIRKDRTGSVVVPIRGTL